MQVIMSKKLFLYTDFFHQLLKVSAIHGSLVLDATAIRVDGVGRIMQESGYLGALVDTQTNQSKDTQLDYLPCGRVLSDVCRGTQ